MRQQGGSHTPIHPDNTNAVMCLTTVWHLRNTLDPCAQVLLANERLDADVDLNRIAEATDSFSGSDLNALCTAAAMIPVRELLRATGRSAQVCTHVQLCRTAHPYQLLVVELPLHSLFGASVQPHKGDCAYSLFCCAHAADDG